MKYLPSAFAIPSHSTGIAFYRTTWRDIAAINDEKSSQMK